MWRNPPVGFFLKGQFSVGRVTIGILHGALGVARRIGFLVTFRVANFVGEVHVNVVLAVVGHIHVLFVLGQVAVLPDA